MVYPALPTNILKGRGLICCAGRDKSTKSHALEVKEVGRVELIGECEGVSVKTKYRCLEHNQIHLAYPSNILQGHGLRCCQRERNLEVQAARNHAASIKYDEILAKHGKLKRLDKYVDTHTQIRHKCLIHGEIHLAYPSHALQGAGLKCCLDAGRQRGADRKKNEVLRKLNEELHIINPNLEWVGGEYIDRNTHLLMRCKRHGETHPASWGQIIQGCGIKCCRIENLSRIGKNSLNRFECDSVWRVLTGTNQRSGSTYLYLYESPEPGFNKFGIAKDLLKRAKGGCYGKS